MDIKDFQRIAKAVGMKPTDRDDMAEIASPDGEDAYVLRLGAVADGSEVDAVWLSLQRGLLLLHPHSRYAVITQAIRKLQKKAFSATSSTFSHFDVLPYSSSNQFYLAVKMPFTSSHSPTQPAPQPLPQPWLPEMHS